MTLRSYIQGLTRSEFEQIVAELNLTDEENNILYLVKKGKSNVQIADACCCSLATIGNRIKHINTKLSRVKRCPDETHYKSVETHTKGGA